MSAGGRTERESILLTGASGLLGRYLGAALAGRSVTAVGHNTTPEQGVSLDLTDPVAAAALLDRIRPSVIVHAAALADVDRCEKNPALAWSTNVEMTRHLAVWAANQPEAVRFIYLSTDQNYDAPGPSSESRLQPRNIYGLTKLWAEDLVRALPRSLVLRVNFLGLRRGDRSSLIDWMVGSLHRGEAITLFKDALFNPLYAGDLARLVNALVDAPIVGTFNCSASDNGLSKADLGLYLANALGVSTSTVRFGSVADVKLSARRPRDTRMNSQPLMDAMGIRLPETPDTLQNLLHELQTTGSCYRQSAQGVR